MWHHVALIFACNTSALPHVAVYGLSEHKICSECGERSNFLSLLQKSLRREREREEKKLHLQQINTSSGHSKMDDMSDLLNLLEQKVIIPLSEHSCMMTTAAERTRTDPQELVVMDTQNPLTREETLQVVS